MTIIQEANTPKPEKVFSPKAKQKISFKRTNSIGTRLFLSVMGGALLALGGSGFVFYRQLEQQATEKISLTLSNEVITVENKLLQVKQAAQDLGQTVKVLKNTGEQEPKIYQNLILEFFLKRPKLSMAAYFLQAPYGVISNREWYGPYFYADQNSPNQIGKRLEPPNINVFYADLYTEDNYPTKEYYVLPASTLKPTWTEPYIWYGITMTSFLTPNFDSEGRLAFFSGMDVSVTDLSREIKSSVINNQGYFVILSEQGKLMSYPVDPTKATSMASYETIPELQTLWSKLQDNKSGLIRYQGLLWAYERVPSTNWLMLAVVPESVILTPVLTITLGSAVLAGLILAGVVWLFVRYLNRRLQPILNECNKLAQTDPQTLAQIQTQDEIGQLSTSFYNLLSELAIKEQQRRAEAAARLEETQEKLKLATLAQQEGEALYQEVDHLLDTVLAIEEGNLAVEAQVSDRATGLVADSLNRLIEQLNNIISIVLSTSAQVTQRSKELETLASATAGLALQQTYSVEEVKTLIFNFNKLSQTTAQQALRSDEAVQEVQTAVNRGEQEISKMNEEIVSLIEGKEQMIKRTQLLNNFVNLAAEFAVDQKRIAALTRVLALNASMTANRAATEKDPEQFASVVSEFEAIAKQVNDLASQTNENLILLQQRTEEITTVVSGLNFDVEEISKSVNEFSLSVDQSRFIYDNIKTVTDVVASVGQQVTQSSQEIATTAQTTLQAIENIAQLAATTDTQSRVTREKAELMDRLAQNLLEKVRFFQLSPKHLKNISDESDV